MVMDMKTIIDKTKNILWLAAPFWRHGKTLILFGIFNNGILWPLRDLFYVYTPQLVVNAIERGHGLLFVSLMAAGLYAADMMTRTLADWYYVRTKRLHEERIMLGIRQSIYDKARATDYACIDDPDFYDKYKWALDNYSLKSRDSIEMLNQLLRGIMCIATLSAVIATVSPWIVLIVGVYAVVRTSLSMRVNKIEIKKDEEIVPRDRRLDYVHRLFYLKDYASDLRSTRLGNIARGYYDKYSKEKLGVLDGFSRKHLAIEALVNVIYGGTQLLIMLLVVISFYRGDIANAAMLVTMFVAANNLTGDLWDIMDVVNDFDKLSRYSVKIREFFAMPSKIEGEEHPDAESAPDGAFTLEIRDVSFRYTDDSPFVLRHLSLTLNAGEKLALVGENGAGKSTLVKLLLRFYDVTEGQILINGVDIRDYDVHELRHRVGVAFQDTNVYAMTLRENVSLSHPPYDGEALEKIITELKLDHILDKNDANVDCEMTREFSDGGIMVSGGEAQKIALARLRTYGYGMLLLDEPSSALDPIAEYEMTRMITRSTGGASTILIAHRLSSVRDMDRIVLVSGGRVSEAGTHDELMELGGIYAEMFKKQAEGYRE